MKKSIFIVLILFLSIKLFAQNIGSCGSPFATLTVYADYNAADAAYTNQQQTWSPAATTTSYTYAYFNSGPSGHVGFDFSNNSTAASGGASGCLGNSSRSIKIFAVGSGCNWSSTSLGTQTTGSNGSTWSNPEVSGLTPNTLYVVVTEIVATTACTVTDQYLTFYQITDPVTCSTCATASCPVSSATGTTEPLAIANLNEIFSPSGNTSAGILDTYGQTLAAGESATICVPVTVPTGSTMLGFKQKATSSPGGCSNATTAPITYQLRPASNCAATPITPTTLNANSYGSGFNPEWNNLAAGNYILCYTMAVSNSSSCTSITVDGLGYYNVMPVCTPPTITTQPSSQALCNGANTSFTVAATGATSYQWQVNTGSGWTNVTNGGVYSGATTVTLTITGAISSMNSYQYKCIINETTGVCPSTSNIATLTVNSGVNPTYTINKTDATCSQNNGAINITGLSAGATLNWTSGPTGATTQASLTNVPVGTYTVNITSPSTAGGTVTSTLFSEEWEGGGTAWTIAAPSGPNILVVDNNYTGGTCQTGMGPFTVPNVPNQVAAIPGNPNSKYLHIKATTTTGATCGAGSSTPFPPLNANFDGAVSDQKITMNNVINTTGYTNINLTFYWLCRGDVSGNDYGAIEYTTNGSTWTQIGAKLNGSYATWNLGTRTDPTWANQANLKFRIRWINNASSTPDPPIALDHFVVTGDQTTTPACGATVTETIIIGTTNTPVAPTVTTPVTYCVGDATSALTATGTGSLLWYTTATLGTGSATAPTPSTASATSVTYYVSQTVTGCEGPRAPIVVNVNNCCVLPTATAIADFTISCTQNPTGKQIGATSVNGVTYAWSPALGLDNANISNPNANPTVTTVYTLTATGSSSTCTATDQITVTVNKTAPTADAGSDGTITCTQNTSGIVIGEANNTANIYAWSPSTGLSLASVSNPTATPTITTVYTVTTTNTASGCSDTDDVTITVTGALATAEAGTAGTISCAQNPTGLSIGTTNNASFSYVWLPAAGLDNASISNPIATPTITTVYSVTTTNTTSGCSATDNVTVTVNLTAPTALAGNDGTISCTNASVALGSPNNTAYTYSWSPSTGLTSSTVSNPTATPSITTNYVLNVTYTASGCTDSDDVTVTVNMTPPTAIASADASICNGATTALNGSGGTSCTWSPATGLNSITSYTPNANPTVTTTYILTVHDGVCTGTDEVIVTVNPIPTANAGSDASICLGDNTTLNATGGTSYAWNNTPDLSSLTASGPVATPINTGPNIYTVTVSDNGCNATDNVTVMVYAIPTADITGDTTICQNNSTVLTASGGSSFIWNVGGTSSSISVSPAVNTTYTLTVSQNGCSDTEQIQVIVSQAPVVDFTANLLSGCAPITVIFTDASAPQPDNYTWSFADGGTSNSSNPTHQFNDAGSYDITLTVELNGCQSALTKTDYINVYPVPSIDYSWSPLIGDENNSNIDFLASSNTQIQAYTWDFGIDTSRVYNNQGAISFTFPMPSTYYVWLYGATEHGCRDSVMHEILIKPMTAVYIPNTFTPNGDLLNDEFGPVFYNTELDNYTFDIYNRWGEIVFTSADPKLYWNGIPKNGTKASQDAVFTWILRYKEKNGPKYEKIGTVTLIK